MKDFPNFGLATAGRVLKRQREADQLLASLEDMGCWDSQQGSGKAVAEHCRLWGMSPVNMKGAVIC